MAQSPSHKFGQIIGDLLEDAIFPILSDFCQTNNLYLDYKHERPARRGKKVTWNDKYGNKHDLDFVFEKDGSEFVQGQPVAFVECAWRRYTKHSRNKAQEIQSAILPLFDTFMYIKPFLGVILAGVFTEGALTQLKSRGFSVLYFPFETIITAFKKVGIDSDFNESTSDKSFDGKVKAFYDLSPDKYSTLKNELLNQNSESVQTFINELNSHFERKISAIKIFTLHGKSNSYLSISDAIKFISTYNIVDMCNYYFHRFEIIVKYTNNDKIEAQFSNKDEAINFLERLV